MLSWETFATGLVTLTRDRSARLRLRTLLLTLQVFFKAARLSLAIPFGEKEVVEREEQNKPKAFLCVEQGKKKGNYSGEIIS